MTPDEIARLPRSVRRQLEAKTRKLMQDLGITPMVDRRNGEKVYDLNAVGKALGLTDQEARQSLSESGLAAYGIDPRDVEPLQ